MRNYFLLVVLTIIAGQSLIAPAAGILGWTWLSLMTPQKLVFGFAVDWPLNEILVAITFIGWLFSKESKRFPLNFLTWIWLAFIAQITLSTVNHPVLPDLAWDSWNKVIRVMALGMCVAVIMTDRRRIHALAWVIALSLGYYAIKGGLVTLVTMGHSHVLAPAGTSISDNNYLALALCMTLPIMYYLYLHSAQRLTRTAVAIAMVLSAIGIAGTYSRGGFVGLIVMGLFLWWQSRNRVRFMLISLALIIPLVSFMPSDWTDRMRSVQDAANQQTFLTRVDSWTVAWRLAQDHPFLGGGFRATENPDTYKYYSGGHSVFAGNRHLPEIQAVKRVERLNAKQLLERFPLDYTGGHAVHSIYLQVLADHGFPGLILFLLLLGALWTRMSRIRHLASGREEDRWARDLVTMMQISMVTYFVAGSSVSMCYYDLPYIFMGLTLAMEKLLQREGSSLPLRSTAVATRLGVTARSAAE